MRIRTAGIGLFVLASLAGCSSTSYGTGLGGGGGGGGGGGALGSIAVGAAIQFMSAHNGTRNPAVDTIAVGGTATWTWDANSGAYAGHSVRSVGTTRFTSSAVKSSGTYAVTFDTAGVYQYDCAVHGSAMTGTIVVR